MTRISLVIPVYNEAESLPDLFAALETSLAGMDYEIICVDDGSQDDGMRILREQAARDSRLKVIEFRRNFGQTAAINAGIRHANGDVVVLMDSDLENDPADIPRLLAKLGEGFDVVSGWRQERWRNRYFTRRLPSQIANRLIGVVSGVRLHDYGCTLKAYRREVLRDVALYGQMHRFIPVYCHWQGGRVGELPVAYRPRRFGRSNYGLFRTYKVLLDLLLIRFLDRFMSNPIHFFGGAGFISFGFAGLAGALALYYKLTGQKDFIQTPLPVVAAMFFVVGCLMVLLGVLAEILMRTYYESRGAQPYAIRSTINF